MRYFISAVSNKSRCMYVFLPFEPWPVHLPISEDSLVVLGQALEMEPMDQVSREWCHLV